MRINIKIGEIFYVVIILLLGCAIPDNGFTNGIEENKQIELSVRSFIRDIYNKNYDGILNFVHSDGVVDANSKISKAKISDDLKIPFLGTIPLDPRIAEDTDKGKPFIAQQSDFPAAKAFMKVVEKISTFLYQK